MPRRSVCLGVSGSVAAVKAPELAAGLLSRGLDVDLVITDAAHSLLQARYRDAVPWQQLLLMVDELGKVARQTEAAPRFAIWRSNDEWESYTHVGTSEVLHVELAKRNQLLLIAPMCANTLASAVHGLCNNLLTCVLRAWRYDLDEIFLAQLGGIGREVNERPVLVAPAMNTVMWHQRVTGDHMKALEARGVKWVPPVSRKLACGDEGLGAMATVDTVVDAAAAALDTYWRRNGARLAAAEAEAAAAAAPAADCTEAPFEAEVDAPRCGPEDDVLEDEEEHDPRAWRRRLDSAEGANALERRWLQRWHGIVECWWVGLPIPTQQRLSGCLGALALHLGSRLETAWRAAQASLSGAGALQHAPAGAADATEVPSAEAGCDAFIEGSLSLPSLPQLPSLDFNPPPIPNLLPPLERLQLLTKRRPPQPLLHGQSLLNGAASVADAGAEHRWAQLSNGGLVVGVSLGGALGLLLSAVLWRREARRASRGRGFTGDRLHAAKGSDTHASVSISH